MFDLNKPLGYDQFLRAFNSGGAGGGPCVATDGETVWAFSTDGGPKYVYRADGKSFGMSHGANRSNGYLPDGLGHGDGSVARSSSGKAVRVRRAARARSTSRRRARPSHLSREQDRVRGQAHRPRRRRTARSSPRCRWPGRWASRCTATCFMRCRRKASGFVVSSAAIVGRQCPARGSASSPCRRASRRPTWRSTATAGSTSAIPRRTKSSSSMRKARSLRTYGRLDGAEAGQLRSANVHGPGEARDLDRRRRRRSADRRRAGRTESRERVELPTATCCASSCRCRPTPTTATASIPSIPSTSICRASRAG